MDTEEVSAGIEQLVDHLRANESTPVKLGDVAGVTEVLLATMRRYFNSIDTTLYSEFRGLSEYIQRARSEISELRPNDLQQDKIPRAGLELEAIVTATENATGTIMDAAEEIMAADPTSEEYTDAVNEACMRIFEACSFQDITGQRITKVVSTLTYIEEHLNGLQDAWGPGIEDAEVDASAPGMDGDPRPDQDLLNGPALDGEGIQQDRVDDLLAGNAVDDALDDEQVEGVDVELDAVAEPPNDAAHVNGSGKGADALANAGQDAIDALFDGDADPPEPEPEPKIAVNGATAESAAEIIESEGAEDEPELDDIVPLTPGANETASQDDIDALFD